ncbi:MAG: hypothetical protein SFU25_08060 [Candidatus Caenarcaniphilales bacterium]|nr:hypothetical protein [Candidatus Caenarcaniphilales bacterium]
MSKSNLSFVPINSPGATSSIMGQSIQSLKFTDILKGLRAQSIRWKGEKGNASGAVFQTSKGPVAITVEHVFQKGGKPVGFYSSEYGLYSWKGGEVQVTVHNKNINDGLTFFGEKEAIAELLLTLKPAVPKNLKDAKSSMDNATITTYRFNRPGVDLVRDGNPDSQSEQKAFSSKEQQYNVKVLSSDNENTITTNQTTTDFGTDFADHGTSGSYARILDPLSNETFLIAFLQKGTIEKTKGEIPTRPNLVGRLT